MAGDRSAGLVRRLIGNWRVWLGIGISVFFLVWAFSQVNNFGTVAVALGKANYLFLLPALAAYFFGVWLRAVRWHYLLRPLRSLPVGRLFPVVVIGYMANDVLPARLGEVVRAYVLGEREGLSKSAAFATIAVERVFDGVTMLAFMAAVGVFVPFDESLRRIFFFAAGIFAAALAAFFVIVGSRSVTQSIIGLIPRLLPGRSRSKAKSIVERFIVGFDAMRSGRLILATLGFSFGAWLAEATMYYLVALGFGLTLPLGAYVLTTAVANLGGMIPSSPGYIGTFELFSLASLSVFGLGADAAISYVLVLHAALLVPVTLLGFFYLWRYGLSFRALQSRSAAPASSSEGGRSDQDEALPAG